MEADELVHLAKRNPNNCRILERLPDLAIDDAWLVSGAVFQTVWNCLTERSPEYGIKDYDIFYHDSSDLSWEAEDRVIKRVTEALSDLCVNVEVRNQARVHLWYEERFGTPYPPLNSAREGMDRFLAPVCMVGLRPDRSGHLEVHAPQGLDDLASLTIRPNGTENFSAERYEEKAKRWQATWPELTVLPAR